MCRSIKMRGNNETLQPKGSFTAARMQRQWQTKQLTCNKTRYSFKDRKKTHSPFKMEGSQPNLLAVQSANTNQKFCTIRIDKYLQCTSLGKTPCAQAKRK